MCAGIVEFACWTAVVACVAGFILALADKWKLIEWAQVHAPNDTLHELVSCRFCLSWWTGVVVSVALCIVTGEWWIVLCPFCSTLITRELW